MINAEPLFDKAMDPYRSRTERHVRALAKACQRYTGDIGEIYTGDIGRQLRALAKACRQRTLSLSLSLTLNCIPNPTPNQARRLRELRREHGWGSDDFWNARRMAGEVLPDVRIRARVRVRVRVGVRVRVRL